MKREEVQRRLARVKGLLLDLDGVLYIDGTPIDGAVEAVERLRERGLPCRFATNTTTISRATLQKKLAAMGFDIATEEIISAPSAAVLRLRQLGEPRCALLLSEDAQRDFVEFPRDEQSPEALVIGDIGERWDYPLMSRLFHQLMGGAELIALHKSRYHQSGAGLRLDIGAFISGLEYASGKAATVIGKPSPAFFELALADMGLVASEVAMIGDDIDSDVGGAQRAGLLGVLVKTGKYRAELAARSPVQPDGLLESIAELRF